MHPSLVSMGEAKANARALILELFLYSQGWTGSEEGSIFVSMEMKRIKSILGTTVNRTDDPQLSSFLSDFLFNFLQLLLTNTNDHRNRYVSFSKCAPDLVRTVRPCG